MALATTSLSYDEVSNFTESSNPLSDSVKVVAECMKEELTIHKMADMVDTLKLSDGTKFTIFSNLPFGRYSNERDLLWLILTL